jgi:predicted ester cyclase
MPLSSAHHASTAGSCAHPRIDASNPPARTVAVTDSNKSVVGEFIARYNSGDIDSLDALFAAGYRHHSNDAVLTAEQFKRGVAWIRRGMPDFRLEILDLVAEHDRVALRMLGTGTHEGSLFGEAPTAARIVLHIQYLCRIEDGHLAEDWEAVDEMDLRRQIGAAPAEG